MSSCLIPWPVSSTENLRLIASSLMVSVSTLNRTYPLCVYLMAFVIRLITTCLIRWSSPHSRVSIDGEISYKSSISLSPILFRKIIDRSWNIDMGSYSSSRISSLPDSILEKSRISLIMVSNASPEFLILFRYSRTLGASSSRKTISVMPTIAFMGVRISWDMLDKNSDFAALAISARSFSCLSFSSSRISGLSTVRKKDRLISIMTILLARAVGTQVW